MNTTDDVVDAVISVTFLKRKRRPSGRLFFLPFALVVSLRYGDLFQYILGVLRTAAFRRRGGMVVAPIGTPSVSGSAYAMAVAAFVVLSLGHAFSSVYAWVSLQHALNIGMAAVLLSWAAIRFRRPVRTVHARPVRPWWFTAVAAIEDRPLRCTSLRGRNFPPAKERSATRCSSPNSWPSGIRLPRRARVLGQGGKRACAGSPGVPGRFFSLRRALSLTGSRGVALALVPALGVLIVLRFGISRGWKMFLFPRPAGADRPRVALRGPFLRSGRLSITARWVFWRSALRVFAAYPFGVGLEGYKYYWFQTQEPFPSKHSAHFAKYAQ